MAYFLSRDLVRDRLRLELRTSFRICPSGRGALISTDDVIALLNRSRVRIADYITSIPTDLMTAGELAAVPELAESGLTEKKILLMTRRAVKVPPHFRINSHCIRFSRKRFLDWLEGRAA